MTCLTEKRAMELPLEMNYKKRYLALLLLLPLASLQAHEISGGGGYASGFSHPVLGLDHLLAMISVGILSAQLGGKAIWTVPSTFVAIMLIGGILGMNGIPLFTVETGIAFSVLALGVSMAADRKIPMSFAMLFVAFFAIFHGHAHGTEMPQVAKPWAYALGFVSGTAVIHISGVVFGAAFKSFQSGPQLLRYVGAGIAGIGFHLLIT